MKLRFLKTLFESPRLTGAVSPSGRSLARAMARAVGPTGDGLVVELGPGTGPVTRALIEHGRHEKQLVLVEYEAEFCRLLGQRFPGVTCVQGDAFDCGARSPTFRSPDTRHRRPACRCSISRRRAAPR